jgi:hypothetical protein
MERIPTELIYLLLFLGIIVFNYVMQQAARRRRAEEEAQAQAEAEAQPQEELPEDVWGRTPAPPPAIVLAPRPAPPPPPAAPPPPPPTVRRPRSPARSLLNTKQGLRQAIVLAMILERPRL